MRARSLKPGLFKNELLGKADPINTLVYEGLWALADRDGRLEDRPSRIHVEINPYRPEASTVQALDWLCARHFIVRYRVDEVDYIWIPTFLDHQNPHVREPPSKLPAPEKAEPDHVNREAPVLHGASIVQASVLHESGTSPARLTPDSPFRTPDSPLPIPDSGLRTPDSREAARSARAPVKGAPRARAVRAAVRDLLTEPRSKRA